MHTKHTKKPLYSIGVSVAVCAVILFLLGSTVLLLSKRIQEQKIDTYKSIDTAIQTFANTQISPTIILFGSSPLRMSSFKADRQHNSWVENYNRYCHPIVLQSILESAGLENNSIFNFAIDGEMASDALAINQKLLLPNKVPKYIVYGITPRDFIDGTMTDEHETLISKRLAPVTESIIDFFNLLPHAINDLFSKRSPTLSSSKKFIEMDEPTVNPEAWDISINEYCDKYRVFDQSRFERQRNSLMTFCKECRRKGIKLLLVNMPLPEAHLKLLPPKALYEYRRAIDATKNIPGISVLDLQDSSKFPNAFFADIARLNENGAHALNLIIANKILAFEGRKANIVDGLASWWLTKAYFSEPIPPDIVVLGSSQLAPLLGADTRFQKKPVDITGDHRSRLLEHDMAGIFGGDWRVLIGALPGAVISDQLVASHALFSNSYKPRIVAITFSPRDFIDKCFPSERFTEAFAFFSKCTDPSSLCSDLEKMRTEKCKFKKTYNYGFENRSVITLSEPFERICPGEFVIRTSNDYSFKDDKNEYSLRYKNPMSPQLDKQLGYLDSLLKYLAERNIKAVAFNLPISAANRALLPNNFWKYYDERITQICQKNQADYVSVDRVVSTFETNEFVDGVHLNLEGGHRLSKTIALFTANRLRLKTFQRLLEIGDKCVL